MKKDINIFQKLLEKFKYIDPLSIDDQKYILKTKRKVLAATLKHSGDYSVIYGLVLSIFFGIKRIGLSLTVAQSTVALGVATALTTISITGGAVIGIKYIIENNKEEIKEDVIVPGIIEEKAKILPDQKEAENNKPVIKYRLGIEPFSNENVAAHISKMVTNRIVSKLKALEGKNKILKIGASKRRKNINRILIGSVGSFGNMYVISARVVDVEEAKVVFVTSEKVKSKEEIDTICDKIAREVSEFIK